MALVIGVGAVAVCAAIGRSDVNVMEVMSADELAIVESLQPTLEDGAGDGELRTMSLLSRTVEKPPVLRLTDVRLSEIADSDMYRFVIRLRDQEDASSCSEAELDSLWQALCAEGEGYGSKCIKKRGTNFRTLPFITVHFESLHELRSFRDDFADCISWIERDMAEFALVSGTSTSLWNLDRIDQSTRPLDGHFDTRYDEVNLRTIHSNSHGLLGPDT